MSDISEVVMVAERILETMRSPLKLANHEVFSGVSLGIVISCADHHQASDLLRDADLAMYKAKRGGRERYAIFNPAMHSQAMKRLQIENDLRKALDHKEFVLYYQPVVDLETYRIRGFETLIRWQHPQRGLVLPDEFIEISEETGLIVDIGRWVMNTACKQLADWQAQFPEQPLSLGVNLSVKELQSTLPKQLENILNTYGLKGHSLVLEVTESMLVKNFETTRDLLHQIKSQGVRVSIDDFGTGYSSLRYLHQLPVNTLKIDRTFVSPAEPDTPNQALVESIIALSHSLGLDTVAEGIETSQQLHWLQQLGCKIGQGFLFSSPVPVDQATELLRQKYLLQTSL